MNKKINTYIFYSIASIMLVSAIILIVRVFRNVSRAILKRAKKYVGNREIYGNSGFENAAFENKMRSAGWYQGAEWCNFFVKMVVCELAKGRALDFFKKALSGSTQQTWRNLQTPSEFHEILKKPQKGCLIIYRRKSDPAHGHIEIYSGAGKNGSYSVISGNSNFPTGGQGVVSKLRTATEMNGYDILGYIKIKKLK